MDQVHGLKTWPSAFMAVWKGSKTFDLRRDDRGFQLGDMLDLHEWDPATRKFSRRHVVARVTYILRHGDFPGLEEGYVIMAFETLVKGEVAEGWYNRNPIFPGDG